MKVQAVIFDLDGTILDNEDEYAQAFKSVLNGLSVKVEENYPQTSGIGVKENWPLLREKFNIKTKLSDEELATKTQQEYIKLLPKVTLQEGVEDYIKDLKDAGMLVALATSSTWSTLEKVFEKFPIEVYFDSITTGEEVNYKKPAPDIFLSAAEKLNLEPDQCLVIEDAAAGVEAAKAAGMKVYAIARSDEYAERLQDADLVFYSFDELSTP